MQSVKLSDLGVVTCVIGDDMFGHARLVYPDQLFSTEGIFWVNDQGR